MTTSHYLGQRVSYDGALCTVRYIGEVQGTKGSWLGVEWDDSTRGKHDGSHKGVRYFTCLSRSVNTASFVRPTRPSDPPRSFLSALRDKYASGPEQHDEDGPKKSQVVISGKVAEEMGFDKLRRRLAQVSDLRIVILEGMCVASATERGEAGIAETCPRIQQLDLSRNLFQDLGPVLEVCRELPALRRLGLERNRFVDVLGVEVLKDSEAAFRDLTELSLDETMLTWEEICAIAGNCKSLHTLKVAANQLSTLPTLQYGNLSSTLTSLVLEYNDFTTLSDLSSLTSLSTVRNLYLKGNNIKNLTAPGSQPAVFSASLQFLDVSYNNIESWSVVDNLPAHFPGLIALRIAHNPVYEERDPDAKTASSEEAHMFTIARLAPLKSLNFSQIAAADRTNAEMFYLSRIAKQLAAVPESAEPSVIEQHPRYADLCKAYGTPDVIRRDEVNPSFLEARLVTVHFRDSASGVTRTARIPKSFDVYAVKGIAGKLFQLPPLKVKLVWETGEWDPVAGFDDKLGDSSDEEDETDNELDVEQTAQHGDSQTARLGRWVRREAELADGPRRLGYCVDGTDVTIRVERL